MAELKSPDVDKFKELVGFDPIRLVPTKRAYEDALEKIKNERNDALTKKVEEQIRLGCDLMQQRDKAVKEFNKTLAKIDKGFGEVMKFLKSVSAGQPPQEPAEEAKDPPAEPQSVS